MHINRELPGYIQYSTETQQMIDIYENLVCNLKGGKYTTNRSSLLYKPKYKKGKENGEYGYYSSAKESGIAIINIMNALKLHSITDLGCGCGILLKVINTLSSNNIRVYGYDNELSLLNIGKKYLELKSISKKNILSLKPSDILSDAIFFWDPFTSRELAREFILNLHKVMGDNQFILSRGSNIYAGESMGTSRLFIDFGYLNCVNISKKDTPENREQLLQLQKDKIIL